MIERLHDLASQSPQTGQTPAPAPRDAAGSQTTDPSKGSSTKGSEEATRPALQEGEPAGTGTLRRPGQPDRDVPLMTIQKDEARVQVGPVTKETGVADVLLGSLGIVAVAVIGSLLLGAVLGGLLVFVKHRLGWGGPDKDDQDHISLTQR